MTTKRAKLRENQGMVKIDWDTRKLDPAIHPEL
jgi:hypothetical protein